MSLGTHSYFARCPQRPRPYWLYVPPSWPQLTRQTLLREPAGRHVSPGQRRWPQQATGGCKLGHTVTQGPSRARLPQPRGHAPPCVTLASLAHLINLGEGNDSA